MTTVWQLLRSCLDQFNPLIINPALSKHTEIPLRTWKDERGRLRVWASNIGAHQLGQSSLEYRLRDASHIKSQIMELLRGLQKLFADLQEVLEEESAELEGETPQSPEGGEPMTEIQEIHAGIADTITDLYRMSMIIRKPAPHDRLIGTQKLDAEPYKFWTKQHVLNKYPNADSVVVERLGSAMALQRAILKYRERHHAKLSLGMREVEDQDSTLSETVVTDLQENTLADFSDIRSDTGISETTYSASLLEGGGATTLPPLPKEGVDQAPFECPYCFLVITATDSRAWARHIFHDLMPYVCIFAECSTPNRLYESRRQWSQHTLQEHMVPNVGDTYDCCICKEGSYPFIRATCGSTSRRAISLPLTMDDGGG